VRASSRALVGIMKDYFINEISTIIDEEKISHLQLSQKIKAKIDDDKFFRAKGVKLASDSTVLPFPPNDSTVLPVLASVSTGIREFQILLDPKCSIPKIQSSSLCAS